jgi:hypothetical protein
MRIKYMKIGLKESDKDDILKAVEAAKVVEKIKAEIYAAAQAKLPKLHYVGFPSARDDNSEAEEEYK